MKWFRTTWKHEYSGDTVVIEWSPDRQSNQGPPSNRYHVIDQIDITEEKAQDKHKLPVKWRLVAFMNEYINQPQTAQVLADAVGIYVNTCQRELKELRDAGAPIRRDRVDGKQYKRYCFTSPVNLGTLTAQGLPITHRRQTKEPCECGHSRYVFGCICNVCKKERVINESFYK